jgi:hypothetical protein
MFERGNDKRRSVLRDKLRFSLPLLVILTVRIAYAVLLFVQLSPEGKLSSWLNLFSGWDSGYYLSIAAVWYPAHNSPYWSFFPIYPALIRILHKSGASRLLCAFMISTTFGLLSIPLFEKVSSYYLTPDIAIQSTILYFLVPPVFVFSAVNYTEPLFLFFGLLSWQLNLERRNLLTAISATLCALTRPDGLLIMIPIAYYHLKSRDYKKLGYLLMPICALSGWLYYGYLMTGGLVPSIAWHFWRTENIVGVENSVTELMSGDPNGIHRLLPYSGLIVVSLAFLVITAFLLTRVWRIDDSLFLYSFLAVAAILVTGFSSLVIAFRSFPRYAAFIFPLGLTLHGRKMWVVALVIGVLLTLDYLALRAFLVGSFI